MPSGWEWAGPAVQVEDAYRHIGAEPGPAHACLPTPWETPPLHTQIEAWPRSHRSAVRRLGRCVSGEGRRPTGEAIGMWSDSSDARDGEVRVTVGVDSHTDQHVGVALDQFGRRLGTRSVPTTPAGVAALLTWAGDFGVIERIGIEGTGSYGAGLTRWLRARGLAVIEVERPHRHDRQARRRRGKSDPLDADAAARAVQAGTS